MASCLGYVACRIIDLEPGEAPVIDFEIRAQRSEKRLVSVSLSLQFRPKLVVGISVDVFAPVKKSKPNRLLIVVMSTVLAFFVSIVIVLVQEYLSNISPEDAEIIHEDRSHNILVLLSRCAGAVGKGHLAACQCQADDGVVAFYLIIGMKIAFVAPLQLHEIIEIACSQVADRR